MAPAEKWTPRGPDGVTILAPCEEAHPREYPGLETGDRPRPMMLFDLKNDPGEQRNVAAEHPEVVSRFEALYDKMNEDIAASQN